MIEEASVVDVDKAEDDDERMYSVTTLIGCLDKPALIHWSATETAKAAVADPQHIQSMIDIDGEEAAIKYLSGARNRRDDGSLSASDLGTAVHSALEQYAKTGRIIHDGSEVVPYVEQFDKWSQEFQPEWIANEVTLFSPTYRYAGTCDGYLKIDGVPLIMDFKTSRKESKAYAEVSLQLAAYRFAEMQATWRARRTEVMKRRYYLLNDTEVSLAEPPPEVEGGIVIKISPESCKAYPVKCDQEMFRSFLYVTEAARWSFDLSKIAVGAELIKGEEVAERVSTFLPKKRTKRSAAALPATNVKLSSEEQS